MIDAYSLFLHINPSKKTEKIYEHWMCIRPQKHLHSVEMFVWKGRVTFYVCVHLSIQCIDIFNAKKVNEQIHSWQCYHIQTISQAYNLQEIMPNIAIYSRPTYSKMALWTPLGTPIIIGDTMEVSERCSANCVMMTWMYVCIYQM